MFKVSNFKTAMLLLLLVIAVTETSSVLGDVPFYFSESRVIRTNSSTEEVSTARATLAAYDANQKKPKAMEGGILFDGVVESLSLDNEKNLAVVVAVDQWFFSDEDNKNKITILTPPLEFGGIEFQVGKEYRIFAVKLNDVYQTWAATGSFELTKKSK